MKRNAIIVVVIIAVLFAIAIIAIGLFSNPIITDNTSPLLKFSVIDSGTYILIAFALVAIALAIAFAVAFFVRKK